MLMIWKFKFVADWRVCGFTAAPDGRSNGRPASPDTLISIRMSLRQFLQSAPSDKAIPDVSNPRNWSDSDR